MITYTLRDSKRFDKRNEIEADYILSEENEGSEKNNHKIEYDIKEEFQDYPTIDSEFN